ncbi:Hypothetical predicted protein [Olea europaea subsp. europaea]|uniref:Uncharacterized protein n=1 Tax=Olea europaea subsp. europaea TaxID=158383 RepID=A0A8S0RZM7_OLEEU|nr:Hypothetical predicted protein [Olea europaea subsp. europaea]
MASSAAVPFWRATGVGFDYPDLGTNMEVFGSFGVNIKDLNFGEIFSSTLCSE